MPVGEVKTAKDLPEGAWYANADPGEMDRWDETGS
jgi:hypothetical protein